MKLDLNEVGRFLDEEFDRVAGQPGAMSEPVANELRYGYNWAVMKIQDHFGVSLEVAKAAAMGCNWY